MWGIARTHSFAAFETCLHEACPDGSLKALADALRQLTSAGQQALAQDLLGESLENHVASPQILWRLEMALLLGQPGTGKDTAGVPDLVTLENKVKELVLANRLDDAIALVSEAARASAAPELYELLGRLHLRRGTARSAAAPALDSVPPAAQPVQAAIKPSGAARAEEEPDAQEAAVRVATRPLTERIERPAETPRAAAAPVEPPRPAASASPSATTGLAAVRSGNLPPPAPTPPAETTEKAPPQWVAEELLKARARAQETMQKRAEAAPVAKPAIIAVAAPAAKPEPAPAPVEIPAPDEPKEQVFARLREAFTKLNKIERKLLAWIMANPNQTAAQIARNTELGSAEVTTALKGLTGLWLDPFTFAGYTVRDYVLECMSMGKQAPAGARPSTPASASRATTPATARTAETPRTPSPAARAAAAPAAAKAARSAAASPALSGLSGLDRQVLEYIGNHPGCSPDEVMDAMGPDEPASVSLVTLRREWLDRDAQGRYTIKPAMLDQIPNGDQPAPPAPAAEPEVEMDEDLMEAAPPRKSRIMETLAASPLAASASAANPLSKEQARLAKLPKGQRQILQFLYDNGQARTKDIARTLDQDAAKVNSALLGPLADFVSVMHSFWRLNDEIRPALAPVEPDEAGEAARA
ncbi:hypothetical protein E0E53_03315 [Azotobacter chroococcum]|nr:hypothetical protein E0E53_03315 [Azotobacter chroococcum]